MREKQITAAVLEFNVTGKEKWREVVDAIKRGVIQKKYKTGLGQQWRTEHANRQTALT